MNLSSSTQASAPASELQPPRITLWTMTLLLVQLGFLALWFGAAAVAPTLVTTLCVVIAALVLGWTIWLVAHRTSHWAFALSRLSAATIVTSVWLAASVVGVAVSLVRFESAALTSALIGGAAAVGASMLRPAPRPSRGGNLRLLQASVLLFVGVGVILFVLLEPELTPEFEGANIGGAILATFLGGPLLTGAAVTMILGVIAEVARPQSWSWLFLAAAAAGVVEIASEVAISFQLGCPAPSRAEAGPAADFSFVPPGINCTYDLGPGQGQLTTEPSMFPTLFVTACVAAYLLLRRAEHRPRLSTSPFNNAGEDRRHG